MNGSQSSDDSPGKKSSPRKGAGAHSISRRLAIGLTTAVGLISAITFLALYLGAIHEQEADLVRKAGEYRDYLVGALELPVWNYDNPTVDAICGTFLQNELVAGVVIKNASGLAIHALGKGRDPDGLNTAGKIYHQGELLGEVEIFLTKRYVKEAGRRLLSSYATTMLFVLISLVLLTHLSMRKFLKKPIDTLDMIVRPYAAGIYDLPMVELPYLEFQAFGRTLARMGDTIRLQMKEIRDAEEKYRSIFENAIEGIFQSMPEGRFLSVNPALAKILGYDSPEELIAGVTDIGQQHYVNPPDRARFGKVLKEHGFVEGFEAEVYRVDGSKIWVSINARAVHDQDGVVLYYEGSVEDITGRRRAEEKIRQLNAELEQRVVERTAQLETANRELESFCYSVSHDLRAPLRHIDGFLELLQKRIATTLDEQSRHYMTTICDSARRMAMLIDDLLSFSRMGRHEMTKRRVDLSGLIEEVIREFDPEVRGRAIRWHVADLPVVTGDRAMLRMVLVNLISNALKFTRPRPQPEIEIGCMPGLRTETIIFIRDNGVGFDMNYVEKLYGVFQRLHRDDEFEGTGIGLANVRRIINRHGGRTWAEGKVGRGATFYFSLPCLIQGEV